MSMAFSQQSMSGFSILVCDDDPMICDLLREAFVSAGCRVLEANSGNAAWALMQKDKKIDCVVTDLDMPDGDGIQLIKNIRSYQQRLPIFLITGFADYRGNEVLEHGVEAVYFKPFLVEEVVEAVALCLQNT